MLDEVSKSEQWGQIGVKDGVAEQSAGPKVCWLKFNAVGDLWHGPLVAPTAASEK